MPVNFVTSTKMMHKQKSIYSTVIAIFLNRRLSKNTQLPRKTTEVINIYLAGVID